MKRTNLFTAGMLLSMIATAAGCAGEATDVGDPTEGGDDVGQVGWQITQVGTPVVTGCGVSTLFDITAPVAIGFLGVNASSLQSQDLTLKLFRMDQFGNSQKVNVQAEQSASFSQKQHADAN